MTVRARAAPATLPPATIKNQARPQVSKLQDLIDLAKEPSSQKRRVLLREITDLFFVNPDHQAGEMLLFDVVLNQLAGDMEEAVRVELAQRMAAADPGPSRLLRGLAADPVIDVARPILEASSVLTDEDLVAVAERQGQEHLKAISRRAKVSETVSEVIVARADDDTLGVLLGNDGAALSRRAHETAVDRAGSNPALHAAVVNRRELPIDLLNEMYFMVEAKLRTKILERNATLDPTALDAALEAGRNRVATQDGALPADYAEAEADVRSVALAELAGIDFHTARVILERRELDALAIVCRAADFERSLFLTFAVLVLDRDSDAMGRAKEYGDLYAELSRESAQRTLRFWKMRRQTADIAA